ncbi:MAG: flagellar biosynthetic protein FliR [bacterium]
MDEIFKKLGVNINVSFYLIFFSLIWVRVLAMTSIVPFLFGKPVPRYVVTGASMVMAAFVFPLIVPSQPPPLQDDLIMLSVLFLKEAFYGLTMGMTACVLFHAMSAVGQMIDNQRGVSIARALIPQLGEQVSISGVFLFQLSLVVYLSIGGHDAFLAAFYRSYVTLPVLGFPVTGPGLFPMCDLFMKITGEVLYISMQMAMPVIIAIFISDIILGIANRVAPQINVWELGFNVKGYLGVLLLFMSITVIGDQIKAYTLKSNWYVDQMVELMQGKVPEGVPLTPEEPEEGLQKPEEVPQVKTVK